MQPNDRYRPAPRITSLGKDFYDEVAPARFPARKLRYRNGRAASTIGLDALNEDEWEAAFARFVPLPANLERPLALRYHGHQFDVYNPHLGDGRGFLFAQCIDDRGRLLDLGTKGSGRTPWSRGGDGKLTLKGGVREVLATEMLEALGVDTSRTFSLFETGEALIRGDEPSPTRSSVLVRLSHSHVRFGTFQRHFYEKNVTALEALLGYVIPNFYPAAAAPEAGDRVTNVLRAVTARAAELCASYMVSGFVHGVLNSDNMNITGESFDYGPWRFLPAYDPTFTAAYFDEGGLYAFGQQPRAIFRNLMRLAECLRPLAPDLALGDVLKEFEPLLERGVTRGVVARLGVRANGDLDGALMDAAFAFMSEREIGYDQFFFDLHGGAARIPRAVTGATKSFYAGPAWDALKELLVLYEPLPQSDAARDYYAREAPETMLIDEVERVWKSIDEQDDWSAFEAKIKAVRAIPRPATKSEAPG